MSALLNCLRSLAPRSRKQMEGGENEEKKPEPVKNGALQTQIATLALTSRNDEAIANTIGGRGGGESKAVEYTAEPLNEESEASIAAGELLHDNDRVGRSFVNPRMDTSVVPRIAVQRQATLNTDNATTNLDQSPSIGSLNPRLSRDNSQNSQTSLRSRADSKGSSTAGHWLKDQLEKAELECQKHHHDSLIPRSALETLITVENVAADIQARDPDIDEVEAAKFAHEVCNCAKRLYATLAYTKKGGDIKGLLGEGITDEDLPFVRKANEKTKFALSRRNGGSIQTLESWTTRHIRKFDLHQWWVSAPIFKLSEEMYELDDKTIFPFVVFETPKGIETKKQGGYSEVYPVRIHPAHHEFWETSGIVEDEPLVAVKQLFSDDENEFQKERTILTAMSMKNHPHLIKLLATYKYDGKYHLMFPFANANLRKYWDDRPNPLFDKATVLWSLQQMTGISNGLLKIHNFSVTRPLSINGPGNARVQKDAKLSVQKGEEWFGRHGDIKPENILWFAQHHETENARGVLQIADFGLGRFHGRDSRSHVNPDTVFSSPTYEPPECKLRLPVSRAYDMWSLGCLYLEFITWLLKGSAEIDGFSNFRGREATATGIDDDNFFTIINDLDGPRATVREQVVTWTNELHGDEKCSQLIHDLLDLTMKGLLVVNSDGRHKATWLYIKLKDCLDRASRDEEYLLKPVPRALRPEQERANSAPGTLSLPKIHAKTNPKRGSVVTFTDSKVTKENVQTNLPRDLVFRNRGTPAHMKTWPTRGPQTMIREVTQFAR